MAQRRSRKEALQSRIDILTEKINNYSTKIQDLQEQLASAQGEYDEILNEERKAAEEQTMKEVLELMREKDISITELHDMLADRGPSQREEEQPQQPEEEQSQQHEEYQEQQDSYEGQEQQWQG